MNTANKLTLTRVVMIPIFLVVLYLDFAFNKYIALAIFILASITDFIDGYVVHGPIGRQAAGGLRHAMVCGGGTDAGLDGPDRRGQGICRNGASAGGCGQRTGHCRRLVG